MHKHLMAGAALLAAFTVTSAADIVVVGHPSAAPMTKEQVADIFRGKNTALSPVDQPEAAAVRAEFYKKATGRDPSQVKATWARLTWVWATPSTIQSSRRGLPPTLQRMSRTYQRPLVMTGPNAYVPLLTA